MMALVKPLPFLALSLAGAGLLTAACMNPRADLHPVDPPPNIADGQTLITIPDDLVADLSEPETVHNREATLQAAAEGVRVFTASGRAEAIRAHRIVTGMTVEEVVLAVGSQPTAERLQGPPGGRTLLWEPPGLRVRRVWVRFNEWGHASAAGTN